MQQAALLGCVGAVEINSYQFANIIIKYILLFHEKLSFEVDPDVVISKVALPGKVDVLKILSLYGRFCSPILCFNLLMKYPLLGHQSFM